MEWQCPPRDAHAAELVINGQTEFDELGDEWFNTSKSQLYPREDSNNNYIFIENANINQGIRGAYQNANVNGNKVYLKNVTISGQVYGGWSNTVDKYSEKYTASNNVVIIDGGEINNTIVGGYSLRGDVIGNTVILKGNAKILQSTPASLAALSIFVTNKLVDIPAEHTNKIVFIYLHSFFYL